LGGGDVGDDYALPKAFPWSFGREGMVGRAMLSLSPSFGFLDRFSRLRPDKCVTHLELLCHRVVL